MKVFIIAAISADGFIARRKDDLADWTSKEDKQLFVKLTRQAGIMVMGNNTFKTIGRALPGRKTVVYSNKNREDNSPQNIEYTKLQPKDLITNLKNEGYNQVAICGGSSIYSYFLEAGVVDEIYLTIEPVLFGEGIKLFSNKIDKHLELIESNQLNINTMLLHYKIINEQ